MKKTLTGAALFRLPADRRALGRDPRAGARESERRNRHADRVPPRFSSRRCASCRTSPTRASLSDAELAKTLAQVTPQAIVTVIDEMLLMQRATELGLSVTDAQFNQVLESIRKDNKIESRGSIRGRAEERRHDARAAEADAQQADAHRTGPAARNRRPHRCDRGRRARLLRRASLRVRNDAERDASRDSGERDGRSGKKVQASARSTMHARRPQAIRARIVKGEPFEKVAAEVSDAPSKANGGLIGPISRDEMNEELLKMIAKMKVGRSRPVMNTATGAQFFKLESSIESTTLPFESARARIADRLTSARRWTASSRSTWRACARRRSSSGRTRI